MLNSIKIQNFKAIQDELDSDGKVIREKPLELKNLARINYLVGPNGCGKSSVLEGVQFISQYRKDVFLSNKENLKLSLTDPERKPPYIAQSEVIDLNTSMGDNFKVILDKIYCFEFKNYKLEYNKNIIERKCITIQTTSFKSWTDDFQTFWITLFYFLDKNKPKSWHDFDAFTILEEKIQINKEFLKQFKKSLDSTYKEYVKFHGKINSVYDLRINNFYKSKKGNIVNERNKAISILSSLFFNFKENLSAGESLLYFFILNLIFLEKLGYKYIFIEELENHLHPNYQKLAPKIFTHFPNLQFLISTHSPFIINSALELNNKNKGKEIINKVYRLENGICPDPEGFPKTIKCKDGHSKGKQILENSSNYSSVFDGILGGLGVSPSDLLFANGVIWVEGPIDALYIEKWLNLFQKNKDEKYKKGLHYSIQCLSPGGWAYASLSDDENKEYPKAEEIINLIELSRKNFLVIDSDTDLDFNGEKKTGQIHTKERIKSKLVEKFKLENSWITDGTIENYIYQSKESLERKISFLKKVEFTNKFKKGEVNYFRCIDSKNKTELCKKIFDSQDLEISDFCCKLKSKVETLYNTIQSWNLKSPK